jgi:hypothetical protein
LPIAKDLNMRASLAISLSVLAAAAGGGCSTHAPRTDSAAGGSAPPGLTLPAGKVFSLDTTTEKYVTPIAGTTAVLVSILASPGGQRRIELRDAGKTTVIAFLQINVDDNNRSGASAGTGS